MINEIYKILSLYKSIQLCLINSKGRILLNSVNCLDDIDFERLTRRNIGNGIYFLPPVESNILFLDDLCEPDIIPYQAIIIQTSKEKFQAHIITEKVMTSEQRTKLQRQLVKDFSADPGATSGMQPRRLPGFFNQKYSSRPLVQIVKNTIGTPDVPIFDINSIKIEEPERKVYNHNTKIAKKNWNDFYSDDFSSADMRYACYLLRMGLSDSEIADKLTAESQRLSERKSGHVEDYLDRTIQKARQFIF